MKICYFTGGSLLPSEYPKLEALVERYITQYGVKTFVVGRSGSGDRMAASAVIAAKERYPEIKLILLLPTHPADRQWKLPEGFDDSFYPGSDARPVHRLSKREVREYMADRCQYLVSCDGTDGKLLELIQNVRVVERDGKLHIEDLEETEDSE